MKACIINYYFFKDILKNVKESITEEFEYDDSLIFNFSNFLTIPYFTYCYSVFKKDKYNLYEKFNQQFDEFFIECVISLYDKNDYKRLFFLYALISTKTFHDYLEPYILKYKEPQESLDDVYNMLDYYYAYQDGIDVTKTSLYEMFNNAYSYYDYVDDLIHNPLVKTYHFIASREYFIRAYKSFYTYCRFDSCNKNRGLFRNLGDLFSKKRRQNRKLFFYKSKLNTSILDRRGKDDNINALIHKAKVDTLSKIDAINDYLFAKNEKTFRKKFNIQEDKKI